MKRSNTSEVLLACKSLLVAVHEKNDDTKQSKLPQNELKYGSCKQEGADVRKLSSFIQQTLTKCFLNPVQDQRRNRKGQMIREGRKYLLNVDSLILFMLDLIFITQNSGCNLHFIHKETKSQGSCFT